MQRHQRMRMISIISTEYSVSRILNSGALVSVSLDRRRLEYPRCRRNNYLSYFVLYILIIRKPQASNIESLRHARLSGVRLFLDLFLIDY